MYILALETTGEHASVAIINEAGLVWEASSPGILNHLQSITQMIRELVEKCQLTLDDVDVVAASEGPGSFTGIRIGVSTARALAQALGKETIGVPTLRSFIYNAPAFDGIVLPIFDARREQLYGGAYKPARLCEQLRLQEELIVGGAYGIEEFLDKLTELASNFRNMEDEAEPKPGDAAPHIMVFGDGIKKFGGRLQEWRLAMEKGGMPVSLCFAEEAIQRQRASSVARLALDLYKTQGTKPFPQLMPNYMRKAEAQRRLEEGMLK